MKFPYLELLPLFKNMEEAFLHCHRQWFPRLILMKSYLSNIAQRIWPDFETLGEVDRTSLLRELFGVLYGLSVVAIALVWLIVEPDLNVLAEQ